MQIVQIVHFDTFCAECVDLCGLCFKRACRFAMLTTRSRRLWSLKKLFIVRCSLVVVDAEWRMAFFLCELCGYLSVLCVYDLVCKCKTRKGRLLTSHFSLITYFGTVGGQRRLPHYSAVGLARPSLALEIYRSVRSTRQEEVGGKPPPEGSVYAPRSGKPDRTAKGQAVKQVAFFRRVLCGAFAFFAFTILLETQRPPSKIQRSQGFTSRISNFRSEICDRSGSDGGLIFFLRNSGTNRVSGW